MTGNFFVDDLVTTALASVLFPLFLLVPGYVVGWYADAFGFRRRLVVTRLLLSVLLSATVVPVMATMALRFGGFPAAYTLFALTWALGLWRAMRTPWGDELRQMRVAWDRRLTVGLAVAAGYCAVMLLSGVDLDFGNGLYCSTKSYVDDSMYVRHVNSIARTGIPPVNPLFLPEQAFRITYHYAWYGIAALVDRLGGSAVSARAAYGASNVWGTVILLSLAAGWWAIVHTGGRDRRRGLALTAALLLLVGGLDVIPLLREIWVYLTTRGGAIYEAESWNRPGAVYSWMSTLTFVPHHISAMAAGFVSLLLVRSASERETWRSRVPPLLTAGTGIAGIPMTSIWVAFAYACALAVLAVVLLAKRHLRDFAHLALAGAAGLVLSLPYLIDVAQSGGSGQAPMEFWIRGMQPVMEALAATGWFGRTGLLLANAALLPVTYTVELGFWLLAGVLWWRRIRPKRERPEVMWWIVLGGVALVVTTFLRTTYATNDLGWRGILFAQAVLLFWGTEFVHDTLAGNGFSLRRALGASKWNALAAAFILLGAASSVYDLTIKRVAFPIEWRDELRGAVMRDARRAHEWVDRNTPRSAVVQYNGSAKRYCFHGLYSSRQLVAFGRVYNRFHHGPSAERYEATATDLRAVFDGSADLARVAAICELYSIDYLLLTALDAAWSAESSWRRAVPAQFELEYAAVYSADSIARAAKD